ncbi:MAG: hypothetical protein EOO13_10980 [Chitinophagaceae bacterium]|nr:MAG: hypothetical protein EOO13_10980 [Chitinophagaceae bacterium]
MKRDPSAEEGTPGLGDQYKDERTEKRLQEHLNNENDIITEEDIANAPVGPVNKEGEEIPVEIPEEKIESLEAERKDQEETKLKDNEDPGIGTSWNVLEP